MSRYDGLIIPRSYSEYINKTDAATLLQALQLSGVMDNAPTAQSTKPAKSGGIFAANAVIMASGSTLTGVAISAGSVVRVLFTTDLNGSDTTTGLQLTYNGTVYAVKIGKNGALANFNAYEVESGVFKYLQAYTTLELMFDGTQFIIAGNPLVLSGSGYEIHADGMGKVNEVTSNNLNAVTSNAVSNKLSEYVDKENVIIITAGETTKLTGIYSTKQYLLGITTGVADKAGLWLLYAGSNTLYVYEIYSNFTTAPQFIYDSTNREISYTAQYGNTRLSLLTIN